jgi:hypothetical protein
VSISFLHGLETLNLSDRMHIQCIILFIIIIIIIWDEKCLPDTMISLLIKQGFPKKLVIKTQQL